MGRSVGMYVCARRCLCMRACLNVCASTVCVVMREKERERERECVCVCVCVRACVCVCV